ncbi:hypothetical protein C8F01DRAFT_1138778 [Mycena amicta]|nr:hypothetical protein C8F01DRAFT_1138778 [Mycena amicta]
MWMWGMWTATAASTWTSASALRSVAPGTTNASADIQKVRIRCRFAGVSARDGQGGRRQVRWSSVGSVLHLDLLFTIIRVPTLPCSQLLLVRMRDGSTKRHE